MCAVGLLGDRGPVCEAGETGDTVPAVSLLPLTGVYIPEDVCELADPMESCMLGEVRIPVIGLVCVDLVGLIDAATVDRFGQDAA